MLSILKKPSAWIPIALTVTIIAMMALYFAKVIPPEPPGDEGTMAHSFQLWAVLEFISVVIFAAKWLPSKQQEAWKIIALQIALAIIPFAIVWFLEH